MSALLSIASLFLVFTRAAEAAPPKAKLGGICATSGDGAGQCGTATHGLAVDLTGAGGVPAGSVYLIDGSNNRIQQFSADGAFIRAFGKEVDQTTGGDICTAASGDVCKAGVAGEGVGRLNAAWGIAIDQTTGTLYVSEQNSRRVDVFSATGVFEGAIGWNVDASAPAEELQFCTAATGCKTGVAGPAAGQLSNLKLSGLAVDPRTGDLYVADFGNQRLAEYAVSTNGAGEVTGASFVRALGWKVDLAAPAEELQECTTITGCQAGSSGWGEGQFFKEGTIGTPGPIAVDSNGYIYAVSPRSAGTCSPAEPCGVQKFNPDGTFREDFGPSSGECRLTYTSGTSTQEEAFDIAVDPVGSDHDNRVFVIKKVGATEYRLYEFDEDGGACVASPDGSPLVGSATVLIHGLAVGTEGQVYATAGAPEVVALGEAPAATVAMTGVVGIGAGEATFVGQVTPPAAREGQRFPAAWHFQYSVDQSHWTTVPVPDKSVSSGPGIPEVVEEPVTELAPGTRYFVRLCATTGPTVCSTTVEFGTEAAAPAVMPFSSEVTATEATLGAEIDPNNLATRYHVEWATQAEWDQDPGAYGHRAPARDREIGSGSDPVVAREQIGGLAPAALFHFRVVATNSAGSTTSPDQQVETLDSCGMTDGRCLELVSRADKGPLASPGKALSAGAQLQFQAAPDGSSLAYTVELGYPEATNGDEAIYLARRGSNGWASVQLNPPTMGPPTVAGGGAQGGVTRALSSELGCAVVVSPEPLTADSPTTVVEAGGANLYRRDNTTGSYQLITSLPPANTSPEMTRELSSNNGLFSTDQYQVIGMSPDCRRIVFRTMYRYPGIPAAPGSASQTYEWDHGTIRNVALIPGPAGPVDPMPTEALPGALDQTPGLGAIGKKSPTNYWRAVSEDGSRSIFTAVSRFGPDSGTRAIFLRDAEDPGVSAGSVPATDISQSETATPNDGNSHYWTASTDGERIFFTARYGLAAGASSQGSNSCLNSPNGSGDTSGEGCDLYEYDATAPSGERLTDLSPDATDARGAGVVGVLDASEDGSYVYFAARGRLGTGGRTESQSLGAGTYNIYLAHGGVIRFVGLLGQTEATGVSREGNALVSTLEVGKWTSRSTPDGAGFVFESSLGVPGGVRMVYLFSAADGHTVCVSCRHDGEAPYSAVDLIPLIDAGTTHVKDRMSQPTILTDNGRLYFYSLDPLATGAVEGRRNLYQWEHGQVSLIATEAEGVPRGEIGGTITLTSSLFGGSSADGGDVYFATPSALVGADGDERWDVYDARIGGGFPEPTSSAPCDARAEGACSPGSTGMPGLATPATATFSGPGNPLAAGHKAKRKKTHHKKNPHHKKNKHRKKKHRKAGKAGRANGDRRAAK
ncbi:MAG TPA: NHL repeat-containing protein [Solirubrobacterales bacterium]|nr:NHL repeat-containing protein [Solirubrobacterales bacterium]